MRAGKLRRARLNDTGIDVDRSAVWEAFQPFVLPENPDNESSWNDGVRRRRKRILKSCLRKLVGLNTKVPVRTSELIKESYGTKWSEIGYANYDPAKEQTNYTPWLWEERRFLASTSGSARFRHLLISAVIEKLKPSSVLEVGCGNGINLLLLANRFPDISFAGIDLTDSGPRLFNELQAAETLPDNLLRYAPLPPREATAFRRVVVRQGTAENLDYADGAVDLVMSILALEQMERIRRRALSEMARVSKHWALTIEPFRDVNRSFWARLNIIRQDYFAGRIDDLREVGLEPFLATDDFPQEVHLRACMTVSRKRRNGGPETHAAKQSVSVA